MSIYRSAIHPNPKASDQKNAKDTATLTLHMGCNFHITVVRYFLIDGNYVKQWLSAQQAKVAKVDRKLQRQPITATINSAGSA
jgi:hypothetical protein